MVETEEEKKDLIDYVFKNLQKWDLNCKAEIVQVIGCDHNEIKCEIHYERNT